MASGAANTSIPETSSRIQLLTKTCEKTKNILKTCNPVGQASKDSRANHIGDGNGLDPIGLFPVDNHAALRDNGPRYDPELLISKRIIRSNAVNKTRLINRDAELREPVTEKPVEDDATFFENLKKRINEDLEKNIISKIPKPRVERSPKVRKRKSLFDSESQKLMKKFRAKIEENSARIAAEENIEHRSVSQNQENIVDNNITLDHKMSKDILFNNCEIDGNSLCATPPLSGVDAAAAYSRSPPTPAPRDATSTSSHNGITFF